MTQRQADIGYRKDDCTENGANIINRLPSVARAYHSCREALSQIKASLGVLIRLLIVLTTSCFTYAIEPDDA